MLPALKVFKWKSRVGSVDRVSFTETDGHERRVFRSTAKSLVWLQLVDGYSLIGKGLFKKETVLQPFIGMTVKTSSGALVATRINAVLRLSKVMRPSFFYRCSRNLGRLIWPKREIQNTFSTRHS